MTDEQARELLKATFASICDHELDFELADWIVAAVQDAYEKGHSDAWHVFEPKYP